MKVLLKDGKNRNALVLVEATTIRHIPERNELIIETHISSPFVVSDVETSVAETIIRSVYDGSKVDLTEYRVYQDC